MIETKLKIKLSTLIMLLAIPHELYEHVCGLTVGDYDDGQVPVTFMVTNLQGFAKLFDLVDNTGMSDNLADILESTSSDEYHD